MKNYKEKFKIIFFVALPVIIVLTVVFLQSEQYETKLLWNLNNGGIWLLPLIAVSALIDSINPCAFSILLLTIAFLFSIGSVRTNILKIGGIYILGIFVVYIFIGLGLLQTLHLFNMPHFMAKVGAIVLIAFGTINLINEFWPSFPIKLKIPSIAHQNIAKLMSKASLPAAFLLGALVGLCEFPCTGGPYLMVLGLLHDQATYLNGLMYLLFYNFIFVLPLIIILLISGDNLILSKVDAIRKNNVRKMRLWGGIAMVILGLTILFFDSVTTWIRML